MTARISFPPGSVPPGQHPRARPAGYIPPAGSRIQKSRFNVVMAVSSSPLHGRQTPSDSSGKNTGICSFFLSPRSLAQLPPQLCVFQIRLQSLSSESAGRLDARRVRDPGPRHPLRLNFIMRTFLSTFKKFFYTFFENDNNLFIRFRNLSGFRTASPCDVCFRTFLIFRGCDARK